MPSRLGSSEAYPQSHTKAREERAPSRSNARRHGITPEARTLEDEKEDQHGALTAAERTMTAEERQNLQRMGVDEGEARPPETPQVPAHSAKILVRTT